MAKSPAGTQPHSDALADEGVRVLLAVERPRQRRVAGGAVVGCVAALLDAAWQGFNIVFSWPNILYPTAATLLAMVFALNWRLALLSMLIVPLMTVPTRLVGRVRRKLSRAE